MHSVIECTYMYAYIHSRHICTSPGILSVAAGILAVHYELLVKTYDGCPIPMFVGESETGECKPKE